MLAVILLHCALSLAAQCIVIGPVCNGRTTDGWAVSEPYYSQRARSVCVSLSVFSHYYCYYYYYSVSSHGCAEAARGGRIVG